MKKKDFDAVKMMRDIRTGLSDRYGKDPSLESKDLAAINKKYGIRPKPSSSQSGKTA